MLDTMKVGDCVELVCGGAKMVISDLMGAHPGPLPVEQDQRTIQVSYFANGCFMIQNVPTRILRPVESDDKSPRRRLRVDRFTVLDYMKRRFPQFAFSKFIEETLGDIEIPEDEI